MEVDSVTAIHTLQSVLTTLMSGVTFHRLLLAPERVLPAGIGGFVGMSRKPRGEITAVRMDAVAHFTIRAPTRPNVDAGAQNVITAMLGARRSALVPVGIQRIALVDAGAAASADAGNLERNVSFKVSYEFQQAPQSAEGVIASIPIDLRTVDGSEGAILDADFMPGSLSWFEVVDDSRATQDTPSSWGYDVETARITQQSTIRGGQNIANANKPGTYLLLRTTPERPPVRDFRMETTFRSEDPNGGVGLVFRYQDANNFYFLLMDRGTNFRMFARKLEGSFTQLQNGGINAAASFTLNQDLALRLVVTGSSFEAFLDGQSILTGSDSSLVAPGRVGFMSRRNGGLFLQSLRLVPT